MPRPARPRRVSVLVAVVSAALAPSAGLADVSWETTIRITDALGRGAADLDEAMRTVVTSSGRREEVRGVRRMTSRQGRQYNRPGHVVTLQILDDGATYDLDLDAGSYTMTSFPEEARERERQLREAEATFREVPPEPSSSRPITLQRSEASARVNGVECTPTRIEARRDLSVTPPRDGSGPASSAPVRYAMTLDVCMTAETAWSMEIRRIEQRLRELTGETDTYLRRLLDVLARRRDLFAVFDDLHYRLERARRELPGQPIRWVETMTGPRRDNPEATLYRSEGTVTMLRVGPVEATELTIPANLTRLDRRRVTE